MTRTSSLEMYPQPTSHRSSFFRKYGQTFFCPMASSSSQSRRNSLLYTAKEQQLYQCFKKSPQKLKTNTKTDIYVFYFSTLPGTGILCFCKSAKGLSGPITPHHDCFGTGKADKAPHAGIETGSAGMQKPVSHSCELKRSVVFLFGVTLSCPKTTLVPPKRQDPATGNRWRGLVVEAKIPS